jgi:hypothetical protein
MTLEKLNVCFAKKDRHCARTSYEFQFTTTIPTLKWAEFSFAIEKLCILHFRNSTMAETLPNVVAFTGYPDFPFTYQPSLQDNGMIRKQEGEKLTVYL